MSTKFSVILHMVCHQYFLFPHIGITAGQVALWMKVSKPTAIEYLRKLTGDGMLERQEESYRPNAVIHYYFPTSKTWELWQDGAFLDAYKMHIARYAKPALGMKEIWSKEEFGE